MVGLAPKVAQLAVPSMATKRMPISLVGLATQKKCVPASVWRPRDCYWIARPPEEAYLTIRMVRSMPSCVCSRPSWVFMKQTST
jgi:hypothetical protein